jgi:SOS-response transcriptional repressor LexA
MFTKLSNNLHWLMARHKIASLSELARLTGVPQPTLHRMSTGEAKEPRHSTLKLVTDYFGVSVSDIVETAMSDIGSLSNVELIVARREVPLLSWDQLSPESASLETSHRDATAKVPVSDSVIGRNAFGLKIVNDSMAPEFPEGSVIIVDPDRAPGTGDFVVVRDPDTGQATFKRLVEDAGRWYLRPLNPSYPTIQIADVASGVIGVVVESSISKKY